MAHLKRHTPRGRHSSPHGWVSEAMDGHRHGEPNGLMHAMGMGQRGGGMGARQGGSGPAWRTPWRPAWMGGQVGRGRCHRGCWDCRSGKRSCPGCAAQVTRSATALARLELRDAIKTFGLGNVRA